MFNKWAQELETQLAEHRRRVTEREISTAAVTAASAAQAEAAQAHCSQMKGQLAAITRNCEELRDQCGHHEVQAAAMQRRLDAATAAIAGAQFEAEAKRQATDMANTRQAEQFSQLKKQVADKDARVSTLTADVAVLQGEVRLAKLSHAEAATRYDEELQAAAASHRSSLRTEEEHRQTDRQKAEQHSASRQAAFDAKLSELEHSAATEREVARSSAAALAADLRSKVPYCNIYNRG